MTDYPHTDATLALMRMAPVIPVLTIASVEDAVAQARALVAGGLPVVEVTLRTADALAGIEAIRREVPAAVVGAGTILQPRQIAGAIEAGATFLVSPGMTPELLDAATQSPIPFLPGVATASEAMSLMARGFRALKFFPAEASGGVKYLSALAGPLPDLRFCPTGGITSTTASAYLALKNVVCVGGSWMLPAVTLAAKDYVRVETLTREAARLRSAAPA